MMRAIAPAALALALTALPAAAQQRVSKVYDGDTVTIAGQSVRLAGIDAPEVGYRARCPREADLGRRATERLRELVAGGVTVERQRGKDKYGRLLAVIRGRGGEDVGAVLRREGLAVEYHGRGPRQDWCMPGSAR